MIAEAAASKIATIRGNPSEGTSDNLRLSYEQRGMVYEEPEAFGAVLPSVRLGYSNSY